VNHHASNDDRKQNSSLKHEYLYFNDEEDGLVHCPEKEDSVFAIFATPKGKKKNCGPM
jgi:hypothetical protein